MKGQIWPFLGQHGAPRQGPRAQAWSLFVSLVVFGEVFLAVIHVGLDRVTAWLPGSGTDSPLLICVLKGLDHLEGLIHGAPQRQVIDGDLAKGTLAINGKEASVGNSFIFLQHAIIMGQASGYISQQGDVQRAQPSLLLGVLIQVRWGNCESTETPAPRSPACGSPWHALGKR